MNTKDIIVLIALVVILIAAIGYIYKAKKSGKRCVGCPDSGTGKCCCQPTKTEQQKNQSI